MFTKFFGFFKGAFEDDTKSTGACSAQVNSFIALAASLGWVTHFMIKHGGNIPDPGTLSALGGFSTIHYIVHRTASAFTPTNPSTAPPQNS